MKTVWVLLQTTRELNLIYVFEPLIGPAEMKKIVLTSESDCLRKNFNTDATKKSMVADGCRCYLNIDSFV